MKQNRLGYMGQILRVDLTKGTTNIEDLPPVDVLRQYVGGTGLGIKFLYEEVPPGIGPYDEENRIIFASGPLGGTFHATGTFSVVTKGPMTNGALSSQANGFMGAYMKSSGFDAIIVQGKSPKPVYIYLNDGQAEIRDAGHLWGKDTWETEDLVAQELAKSPRQISVFGIGPAGENLVRFSCIAGDRGHILAHGGPGAVMASKNLKAIVAARGNNVINVNDKEALNVASETILEGARKLPANFYQWGTGGAAPGIAKQGRLPVKNYLGADFPVEIMTRPVYSQHTERKRTPCWACRFDHCGILTITDGPYKGFVGEEPEYEGFAAFASNIDQTDPLGVVVLSNECDRLGMDLNEAGWIVAWVMECYEKGLLTKKDTDGLEMTWGNVEATRAMLRKIAYREGIGDMLAEGSMRASQRLLGGKAANMAIYLNNGVTPRGHDHRSHWTMILDVATSNSGTDEHGIQSPAPSSVGLPAETNLFSPEGTAAVLAAGAGKYHFDDCLGICRLSIMGSSTDKLIDALNAVTGLGLQD